jgi:hypothetical protein
MPNIFIIVFHGLFYVSKINNLFRVGYVRKYVKLLYYNLKERDHSEDTDVEGKIIFQLIFE